MKKKFFKKEKTKGVVLLEAIIAVSVLAIIFSSTIQLFGDSVRSTRSASDTFVASQLAQDASEFLSAKRLYSVDAGQDWYDELECAEVQGCGVDTTEYLDEDTIFSSCATESNCKPYDLAYMRKIVTQTNDDADGKPEEIVATITVSWAEGGRTEKLDLVTHLYSTKVNSN